MADGKSTSTKSQYRSRTFEKAATKLLNQGKQNKEPSYNDIRVAALKMGKRLQRKYTDLNIETTTNVVTYSRQLPKDRWSDDIDQTIFKAQMFQQFDISKSNILERMYQVAAHQNRDPKLKIESYADLICLFLSSKQKAKIDFAFDCYDTHGDDYITRQNVQYMVSPMLTLVVEDVEELPEHINFVVNSLFEVIDSNKNGRIEREEFHQIVGNDVLMRECLGPCFPDENFLEIFRKKIVNRSNIEVAGTFRNERRNSLRGPDLSKLHKDIFKREYPNIDLEFP